MFSSFKKPNAVDHVLNQFVDQIKKGTLSRGDKLPSETELTTSLGVSRGPVREAMKILKYAGILEIRQGDGTYIKENTRGTLFNPLLLDLMLRSNDKSNLTELRRIIEMGMLPLLPLPLSPDGVGRLRQALDEMDAVRSGTAEKRAQADIAFHSALGSLTGNELLSRIYDFILELMLPSVMETYAGGRAKDPLSYHKSILNALIAGDGTALRTAMETSLEAWEKLS